MNTNLIYCIDTFIYVAISIALSWVASQTFKKPAMLLPKTISYSFPYDFEAS